MQGIEVFILLAMAGLLGWLRSELKSKQMMDALRSELEEEKALRKIVEHQLEMVEHQLEIAEREIMRREELDKMKDTYIRIQKQEKDLMKWQAEQNEGETHD